MNLQRIAMIIGLGWLSGCGSETPRIADPPPPVASPAKTETAARPVPVVSEEPDEETVIAKRALQENCLICHSLEIIATQRLTPKQWKAEVEKMVGWGSPLAEELQDPLIHYLQAEFPNTGTKPELERWTFAEAFATIAATDAPASPGNPSKGEASFNQNCKNCHGNNGEGSPLGPALADRRVLLRASEFVEVIRKGRGRMPMLGPIVDEPSRLDILAWLKTKRFEGLPP